MSYIVYETESKQRKLYIVYANWMFLFGRC